MVEGSDREGGYCEKRGEDVVREGWKKVRKGIYRVEEWMKKVFAWKGVRDVIEDEIG
ncbi:hypothetical protein [Paenibacillus xylanexedens]|uniref:hypothetical protein n=1 Tax=Paenibacillus xylanexedens TaxID=528191 RepID=UPI001643633F|nr:hypothetical protein [Paenibacillus xylanexedens]